MALESFGEVVSINDQIENSEYHNDSLTFDYELNNKAAKVKLLNNSKRIPLEIEKKSTSINLNFSVGAWLTAVLPAVRYWNEVKGEKTCKVGNSLIKVGGIKSGRDANGMHVVSKVVFYVDRNKVVCHLYNTTQRIMVNGKGYEKLTEIFLKPLFQSKVDFYQKEINVLNEEVLKKFGPKVVKRSDVKFKEGSSYPCFRCDLIFKSVLTLNKHKISDHGLSFNTSKSQLHVNL